MSFYKQDPNDSTKMVPADKPANFYTRTTVPVAFSSSKTPNYIIVKTAISNGLGFYFGSATEFSASAADESTGTLKNMLTSSTQYVQFNALPAGTYHLNPLAVSGSAADVAKIIYVYKGGPDGMGRP
jgi:hypothetical protein